MISVRSPIAAVTLVVLAASLLATIVTASHHDDDHHDGEGFSWSWNDNGQSQAESVANCLCWNATTNNWCHHALDGPNTGFWRDSCSRVVYANTWWWIPVTIWCVYLILMPLFFCAFRLCCNCCGGRTPSFGCCCPISNSILSPDPKWTRPYSRCATWTAKGLALFFCAGLISLSVHSFIQNNNVHSDVRSGASMVNNYVESVVSMVESANFTTTSGAKPTWLTAAALSALNQVQTVLPTLKTVQKHLNDVDEKDREHRAAPIAYLVGSALVLVVLVTLVALCNVRSWPISCASGILCFMTLLIVLVAAVTATVSNGMDVYCDNHATIKTFAKTLLSSQELCNHTSVTRASNDTQVVFARYLCGDLGLSATAPGSQFCEEKLGGMFTLAPTTPLFGTPMPSGTYIVDSQRLNNLLTATSVLPPAIQKKQLALLETFTSVYVSLTFVMENNYDCNVVDAVVDGIVSPIVCELSYPAIASPTNFVGLYVTPLTLGHHMNKLGGYLFGLSAMATLAFWVWMNGSKRFTKSATKEQLLGHHEMQHQQMAANLSYDYQNHTNQQTAVVVAHPQGIYDDGVNGPTKPTATVAATVEQPLLLSHDTPSYGGSVNNRTVDDLPMKEQPQPM